MNVKNISRNIGYALLVSALFMFLSVGVSVIDGRDSAFVPLLISAIITFIVGFFPFIFVRKTGNITLKDGYVIIALSWLLSFVFGMLPYALWGGPFTVVNAWFESVSGFTTTGASVLKDVEALPRSLLFWRSSTHFIGGLGVVVFLLLIIPNSSPVKIRLTNMELSSLSRGTYKVRANKTPYVFAYVYLGICILSILSYWVAGMPLFDSICQGFSVSATGGFCTKNLSIASYDSRAIELITMVFMFLSSIHFGLIFLVLVNHSLKPLNNPILKFYLGIIASFTILVAVSLKFNANVGTFHEALWHGAFLVLSAISSSGFTTIEHSTIPLFSCFLLMFAGVMCGCAGSTTGGVKVDRVIVLLKSIGRQIGRILHPSSVNEIRIGKKILQDDEVAPHILYLALYGIILIISVLLSVSIGADSHCALAFSLSSLSNVGLSFESVSCGCSFGDIPDPAKLVLTLDMFLGRVEIFPLLAVAAMIFDRKGR